MQIIFMKDGGVGAPQRVVQKSTAGMKRYHKRLQLFLLLNKTNGAVFSTLDTSIGPVKVNLTLLVAAVTSAQTSTKDASRAHKNLPQLNPFCISALVLASTRTRLFTSTSPEVGAGVGLGVGDGVTGVGEEDETASRMTKFTFFAGPAVPAASFSLYG
jgi:hypothetical protein